MWSRKKSNRKKTKTSISSVVSCHIVAHPIILGGDQNIIWNSQFEIWFIERTNLIVLSFRFISSKSWFLSDLKPLHTILIPRKQATVLRVDPLISTHNNSQAGLLIKFWSHQADILRLGFFSGASSSSSGRPRISLRTDFMLQLVCSWQIML